jgi:signal transduction histidine kinase
VVRERAVLQVIDPRGLRKNRIVPPVYVEELRADRKDYAIDGLVRLPARSRDIEIGYTGLSFSMPQRVRFRYKLEGRDHEWQDAGTRRRAFYTDLSPGQYRFHVTASNKDGVWNQVGATVDFAIAPAYYQTTWFLALSVATLAALVWAGHRVRLRIVETHRSEIIALNERLMNAQEQERTRIAGELHDGVMQEMLAVTMMLGTAKRRIADDAEAKAAIDKVQQKVIQLGTDIRQLSHELHPPMLQEAGFPEAVRAYCDEFSASCGVPVSCDADEDVRQLSHGAALALFRIVQEALGNAAKTCARDTDQGRLKRSHGVVSLAIGTAATASIATNWALARPGLITIRERAAQLGGTFDVDTAPGCGTGLRW